MCIAVPGRVVEINDDNAKVDFNGNVIDVNVGIVKAEVGKYVLVHAGCAIEVMERDRAEEIMEIFKDIEEMQ